MLFIKLTVFKSLSYLMRLLFFTYSFKTPFLLFNDHYGK